MIKRAFFVIVLFGVVLLGAVVTSALPTTDAAELEAATPIDTLAPAAFSANAQTAIVSSEPIGCKYPDICPPPPVECVVTARGDSWRLNADDPSVLELTLFFLHDGCGDDATFVLTGLGIGPLELQNPSLGPIFYQCGIMEPPPGPIVTATATPVEGAEASASVFIINPQPLCSTLQEPED